VGRGGENANKQLKKVEFIGVLRLRRSFGERMIFFAQDDKGLI
jgi:hypothetical protein